MNQEDSIQKFEDQPIRTAWDEVNEEWLFSIVDVVSALTDQKTQRSASTYWAVLKKRLRSEGADELLTNCKQLKLHSHSDGKRYRTDVAGVAGILRIIQSIPSPKAEPFKMWLSEVGKERIDETVDPELAIERALTIYLRKAGESHNVAAASQATRERIWRQTRAGRSSVRRTHRNSTKWLQT